MSTARDPRHSSEAAFLREPMRLPKLRHGASMEYAPAGRAPARMTEGARAEQSRFSDLIRLARKRRMPQAEFAERLGEVLTDVREWEDGRQPIPRLVRARMAALLDLDPARVNADADPTLSAPEWDLVLAYRRRSDTERATMVAAVAALPPPDPFVADAESRR